MPSNAITDCPIYQVLWDLAAYWGERVHHKYEVNAQWGAVSGGDRITRSSSPPHFSPRRLPAPRLLHNSRAGYLCRSREGVTFYRAEWKGGFTGYYLGRGGGGVAHMKLFNMKEEEEYYFVQMMPQKIYGHGK